MIYLIGHSHAIVPINVLSSEGVDSSQANFETYVPPPEFVGMECKKEFGITHKVKYFVITARSGVSASYSSPDFSSGRNIVASDNFLKLIRSAQADPPQRIFCFMNGNEHSALSMIEHDVPYDFMRPGDVLADAGQRQIVPAEAVRNLISNMAFNGFAEIDLLKMAFPQSAVYVMAPPPPVASEDQIQKNPEIFGNILKTRRITHASVRLKYYQEYITILKNVCAALQVQFVESPRAAQTEGGFLDEPYWLAATHGNDAYAKHVLHQISALCQ